MNTESNQPTFPYVPYPTFKAFIGHLHDTIVTDQIDNTMMPANFSGKLLGFFAMGSGQSDSANPGMGFQSGS